MLKNVLFRCGIKNKFSLNFVLEKVPRIPQEYYMAYRKVPQT